MIALVPPSLASAGKWQLYDAEAQVVLANARAEKEQTVFLIIGSSCYTVDFNTMVQTSDNTGNVRSIRLKNRKK